MEDRPPWHPMVGGLRHCTWPSKSNSLKTLRDSFPLIREAAASFCCCWLCVFNVNAFPLLQKTFPGYHGTLRVRLAWHLAWREKSKFSATEHRGDSTPGFSQRRPATHSHGKAEDRSSGLTSGFSAFLPNNNCYASTIHVCKSAM